MLQFLLPDGGQLLGQAVDVGGHVLCLDFPLLAEVVEVHKESSWGMSTARPY